jgi:hypothetical protein
VVELMADDQIVHDFEYKGRLVLLQSRLADPEGWYAEALIVWDADDRAHMHTLTSPDARSFPDFDQANAAAIALARAWIDEQPPL